MSLLGRIKRGVRAAIASNGGIDGAAATTDKARQTTGGWNNLNEAHLPTLADAIALDEIALYNGDGAPILRALAAELGHVAIQLPQSFGTHDSLVMQLADATGEFGDIANAITTALADSRINPSERDAIVKQIDEGQEAIARLRALAINSSEGDAG